MRAVVRMIKSRTLIWARHVARMEELGIAFRILTGSPVRTRRILEDNVRIDIKEIGVNTGNWLDSARHRDTV